MRSKSYFELESKNKNKNKSDDDDINRNNDNIITLLIDKKDKNILDDYINIEIGNENEEESDFLEIDVLPLSCDVTWSEGAIEKHKLLSRIICDWLDLLVVCNYL